MAEGALTHSDADVAVAVTGIAGPEGGTSEKPVGTIFIAWADKNGKSKVVKIQFAGNRQEIRAQTVERAMGGMFF
jgi:nicotinamide-nucleotide amidase